MELVCLSISKLLSRYKWSKNPFEIVPIRDPELLVGQDEELRRLEASVMFGGDCVVEGPYGAGKTSLLRCLETILSEEHIPVYFPRPPVNTRELSWKISNKFNIVESLEFYQIYDLIYSSDKKVVLLVDEAHKLDPEIAPYLQDLSDLENTVIVYAALDGFYIQRLPEIHKTLYDRVVEVIGISLLTKEEVKEMIKRRIESVGGTDFYPFTEKAVEMIAEYSQGAPREALKICSSSLIRAIARGIEVIDGDIVQEVVSKRPSEVIRKIRTLGSREKEVMRLFLNREFLTNQDVRNELKVSSQAAYNILARLMEKELVEAKESDNKGKIYVPKELVKRILSPEIVEKILSE
ncbi:MAG: AAA family ATPase [Candidatus Asgardarchaeia archaeon]